MRPSRINVMTFTVFMAALTTLFSFIPGVSLFFAPLPIALAYGRHGLQTALTATALAGLVQFVFRGPMGVVDLLALTALPALALGYGIHGKMRPLVTGAAMAVTALIGQVLSWTVAFYITKVDVATAYRQVAELLVPDPAKMGAAFQQSYNIMYGGAPREQLLGALVSMGLFMVPASLALGSMARAVLLYVSARWVLPRVGLDVPPVTPFSEWRMPRALSWVVLLCMAVLLPAWAGKSWTVGLGGRIAGNVLIILAGLYMVQGYSVAYHWLRRSMPKGAAATLPALPIVFISGVWLLILAFLGMWDSALDLRQLGAKLAGPPSEPPARTQDPPGPEE